MFLSQPPARAVIGITIPLSIAVGGRRDNTEDKALQVTAGTEHPRNGSPAMLLPQLSAWQWEQAKSPILLTQLETKRSEKHLEKEE